MRLHVRLYGTLRPSGNEGESKKGLWIELPDGALVKDLLEARALAAETMAGLERIFPLLDALCRDTCPRCPDPCCLHAAVYADFRDLLFFSLTNTEPLEMQLRMADGDTCRCLSSQGCMLPRLQRPWICTWYLCPAQRALLKTWSNGPQQDLLEGLERVRAGRKRMEEAFLLVVI